MQIGYGAADRKFFFAALCLYFLLASCSAYGQPQLLDADDDQPESESAALAREDPEVAAQFEEATRKDEVLEQTLAARFARVDPLSGVEVKVAAGVVTLRGLVDDEQQRELATQLANSGEGVVAVNNRLQLDTALNRRLAPVLEDGLLRLKRLIMALPLLAVAGLIIYLAYRLGVFLTRWQRPFNRLHNPFLADLLRHSVRLLILAGGTLVALNLLGATALVSAVLGAAGIAGLALGFAFRDLVENYIAGILLSLRQPFAPNDHVVIEEHEGRVAALTSRATSLITLDGNHLRLPNALVFKGVILNYTRNPTRMFSFEVALVPEASIAEAQQLARAALGSTAGVQRQPLPAALLAEITPSGAVIGCSAWVDQRDVNFYKVRSAAILNVTASLREAQLLPDTVKRVQMMDDATPVTLGIPPTKAQEQSASAGEDVEPEDSIDEQLESERRVLARQNLLRSDAPRE